MDYPALIDALDSVTWYNDLAGEIIKWIDLKPDEYGCIQRDYMKPEDKIIWAQLQIIWMICVGLFGEYGTSPRTGWIEDVEGFKSFIEDITATYREHMEMF